MDVPTYTLNKRDFGWVARYRCPHTGRPVRVRLWAKSENVPPSRQGKREAQKRVPKVVAAKIAKSKPAASIAIDHADTINNWMAEALRDPGAKGELSELSIRDRKRTLEIFTHWLATRAGRPGTAPISEVTPAIVDRYRTDRIKGGWKLPSRRIGQTLGKKAMVREIAVIKRAFNWVVGGQVIDGLNLNPVVGRVQIKESLEEKRLQVQDKSMPDDLYERALERVNDTWEKDNRGAVNYLNITTCYMETLLRLMGDTGLRPGEAREAKWADIDWDKGMLQIRTGKTGSRKVVLLTGLLEFLRSRQEWLGSSRPMLSLGETVIADEFGRPVARYSMTQAWRRYRDRIGIPKTFTLYSLRHRYAHKIAEDHPIQVVASCMGHTGGFATTALYVKTEIENVADSVRATLDKAR